MPDDSVSEITDLDKEEIMAKYYEDKLTAIEKRKRERAEARRRLRGENTKANLESKHDNAAHVCKKLPKSLNPLARNLQEETVEMELRPKSEGKSLHDEEGSAHQFSVKDMSIQADEEEKLDLDMQVTKFNATLTQDVAEQQKLRDIPTRLSVTKSHTSIYNMSPVGKKPKAGLLLPREATKSEMGMQTDVTSNFQMSGKHSIKKVRMADGATDMDSSHDDGFGERWNDPDAYKEDWYDALLFKKAMKAEAIKRGVRYDSDFSVKDDDEHIEMTTINQETMTIGPADNMESRDDITIGQLKLSDGAGLPSADEKTDGEVQMENAQDAQHPHLGQAGGIGFMKRFGCRGNICMLTENEILYVKTLLKQETENWESKQTLNDLFRHCKFTIRKLTRQMANIDNIQLFRKHCKVVSKENTLFMVYRAERLYSSKGDAEKIFKHVAHHLYDSGKFEEVVASTQQMVITDADEKFLKKRE